MNLSEVYKSIAEASVNLGDGWPDADKFRSMLDVTPDGKFVATHFPDDDGPLGVFSLMTQTLTHCTVVVLFVSIDVYHVLPIFYPFLVVFYLDVR